MQNIKLNKGHSEQVGLESNEFQVLIMETPTQLK